MAVNLDILREYLNHDEKMVHRFLQLFCTAVPQDMEKLKQYIGSGDINMVSITAHGIKTQCAYMGLEPARLLAMQIENSNHLSPEVHFTVEKLESVLLSEIAEMRMTMNIQ